MKRSKRCSKCFTILPLDREHFYFDSHKGDFCSSCKLCKLETSRSSYHRNKNSLPEIEDIRLLHSNYKALESLLKAFKDKGQVTASLLLEGASEPISDGIQFFKSSGTGIVRFTTISGTQTRKLPFISVESLAHILSNFNMRILSHD